MIVVAVFFFQFCALFSGLIAVICQQDLLVVRSTYQVSFHNLIS